jgi:hypothetical protein
MLTQFLFLMSALHTQWHYFVNDYETVTKGFTDNHLEVKYFKENNKGSGDSAVTSMQVKLKMPAL